MLPLPDLYEATIEELQAGLAARRFTSVQLVKAYWCRIEEVNVRGPCLKAVIGGGGDALLQAAQMDKERNLGTVRGILHGIPVLIKDTIHVKSFPTTCGSFALEGAESHTDAHVVSLLRQAGAIFLGKSSLSQWGNFRDFKHLPNGWNSILGQGINPFHPQGSPEGSSGGSATAATLGLAAASLCEVHVALCRVQSKTLRQWRRYIRFYAGTCRTSELCDYTLDNWLSQPHRYSAGLLSPGYNWPHHQIRERCRHIAADHAWHRPGWQVTDTTNTVIIVIDMSPDTLTLAQPKSIPDYVSPLRENALHGIRLGVPRKGIFDIQSPASQSAWPQYDAAFDAIRSLGAVIVDPADFDDYSVFLPDDKQDELCQTDLKNEFARFCETFKDIPSGTTSIDDLIAFNNRHTEVRCYLPAGKSVRSALEQLEKPKLYEGQAGFEAVAQRRAYDTDYIGEILAQRSAAQHQIDLLLRRHRLDALLLPQIWGTWAFCYSAVPGLPMVTVPAGYMPDDAPMQLDPSDGAKKMHYAFPGAPFGLAFLGPAWSEAELLSYAYAFEQATQHRLKRRARPEAVPKTQLGDVI